MPGDVRHYATCSTCGGWAWAETTADAETVADDHAEETGHDTRTATLFVGDQRAEA